MIQSKRSKIAGLHSLEIYHCPIEILEALAREAAVGVTVENIRPVRASDEWFTSTQSIFPDSPSGNQLLRSATFDAAMTSEQFLALLPFWNRMGAYAVFTESSPIAFRASSLEVPARYKALANFGFVLEVALADGTGTDWSGIVSPRADLVDAAELMLRQG